MRVVSLGCFAMVLNAWASAQPIRLAPANCGPSIEESLVVVLDLTGFPNPDRVPDAIKDQVGPYQIFWTAEVVARSAFGHAWKKAQRTAAGSGCNLVLIFDSGRVTTGVGATFVPFPRSGGMVVGTPLRRDAATVAYGRRLTRADQVAMLADIVRRGFEGKLPIHKGGGLDLTEIKVQTRADGAVVLLLRYRVEGRATDPVGVAAAVRGPLEAQRRRDLEAEACSGFDQALQLDITYRHEFFDAAGAPVGHYEFKGSECLH